MPHRSEGLEIARTRVARDADAVEAGNEELRLKYVEEINPLLRQVGLEPPDYLFNRHFL